MKKLTKLVLITILLVTTGSVFAAANISSVTVGAQVGALNYGTAGSATFAVTSSGSGAGTVFWSLTNALPTGAAAVFTPSSTGGNGSWSTTLTITITNTTPAGSTIITVKGTGSGSRQNTSTLTIGKRSVTGSVAVDNKVYDGTTAATITNRSLTGIVGGDAVSLTGGVANFVNKGVGAGKTVTVTNLSLTGAAAASYTLASSSVTTTASITARSLTVSATGTNKVYDATTNATVSLANNRVSNDVLATSYASASFGDKNVGTNKTVSVAGIGVTGTDSANYSFNTTASTAANITAKALTVGATGVSKVYDGTNSATANLNDNALVGDDVTPGYAGAAFSDKNVGTNKTVSVTGVNLMGADAGNYTFNTTASTAANITVLALTPGILADNKVYDGTNSVSVTNRTLAGVISPDVVSLVAGTAVFSDKNVGTNKIVTETGLSLGGVDAGNYSLISTSATTTASITARTLTVGATGQSRTYDGTTNATVTLNDDRVVGDALSTSYGAASFSDKNIGTNKTVSVVGINVTGGDAGNYTFNPTASTAADITAISLTVTIASDSKVYDGSTAAPITNTILAGVIGGEDVTLTNGPANFADKNIGTGKNVTETGLGLAGADAGNYTLASTSATTSADITARALNVSATGVNKVYDGSTNATVTLSDDRVLGDVITNSYSAATFGDKNVGTNKTVGVTGINVVGPDAGNYTFNTTASTTASILGASVTASIAAENKVYDGTDAATITNRSLTGVIGLDDVSVTAGTAKFSDKTVQNGKTVTETGLGLGGATAGNYVLSSTNATTTASITARALNVSATGVSRAYDTTTNATVILSDDRVSGDLLSATYVSASFASKNIGTNKLVTVAGINVTGTDSGNYTFNTATNTTANITGVTVNGSIGVANKAYDGTTTASITNRSVTGVIGADVVTLVGGSANFATKTVGNGKPVTATGFSLGGADGGNYSLATNTLVASANITGTPLTVMADPQTRIYGAPNPALTVSYNGFASGEGIEVLSGAPSLGTTATLTSSVAGGPYSITVTNGTLAAPNYTLVFVNGLLAITPANSTNVVSTSVNPALPGASVTFSASFTGILPSIGTPGSAAQFLVDGSPFGPPATISNGLASVSTTTLAHGFHAVAVRYTGDGNFFGSTNVLGAQELINTPPAATNDTLSVLRNTAATVAVVTLTANDTDADGDTFNMTSVSAFSTQGGTVSILGPNVLYTPPVNYAGADSFTYTITDLYGAMANGAVNVTVQSPTNRITLIQRLLDHNIRLTITGASGLSYRTLAATNLVVPVWVPISTNIAGSNGSFTVDDLKATNSVARYYRTVFP